MSAVLDSSKIRVPELSDELRRQIVTACKMLADPTRLRIVLQLLHNGELHVTALCGRLEQSQPAVSHHLALLRTAGLIDSRRDGKHNYYRVRRSYFHRIVDRLLQSTCDRHDEFRLENYALSHV